jgi:P27 family predicted phage terminase small subunit
MGKGRPPKPTAIKRLSGTLRKHRENREEPQPQAGTPEPPANLDERARAQWDYYAPLLAACRVLTLADREALTCYCVAAGRRAQAEEELAKHGPVVKSPSGYPIQNPWLAIANKAMEQLIRWGVELGLSPASRSRIKTAPQATEAPAGRARFFKIRG